MTLDDYRGIDEDSWNRTGEQLMTAMSRQYDEARVGYAMNLEMGPRVAYALLFEND